MGTRPTAEPVRQALILAAGMGVRLKELGTAVPKGFLRLGARPIVEESIARLTRAGIERVVIVTGHQREFYEELARAHAGLVTTVHNAHYAESGSLYSLCCAREQLDGDLLLLESDIVYEGRALGALLEHPAPDVLLLSAPTRAGDEVWVEARAGALHDMSKDRTRLGPEIAGELVGIAKLSRPFLGEVLAVGERMFRTGYKGDYEVHGLVQASRVRPMTCLLVPDLLWGEIDDARHLERAQTTVYPRLVELDPLPADARAGRAR